MRGKNIALKARFLFSTLKHYINITFDFLILIKKIMKPFCKINCFEMFDLMYGYIS